MFSHHYLGVYLTVTAVIVLGVLLSLGVYVQQHRESAARRSREERPRWVLLPDEPGP